MNLGTLDCKVCDDNQKKDRGCFEDSPIPERWKIHEFVSQRCPLSFIDNRIYLGISAFSFYQKGMTPNNIGWINESNKYSEIMKFIGNIIGEKDGKQRT